MEIEWEELVEIVKECQEQATRTAGCFHSDITSTKLIFPGADVPELKIKVNLEGLSFQLNVEDGR